MFVVVQDINYVDMVYMSVYTPVYTYIDTRIEHTRTCALAHTAGSMPQHDCDMKYEICVKFYLIENARSINV